MSDLNWCTHCDNAISPSSDSLYCSEKCLRSDALNHHPSLGYKFPEFEHFLRDSLKEELAISRTECSRKSFLFEIEDTFPTTYKSNKPSISTSSSISSSSSSNTSNLFKHNPRHV